MGLIVPGFIPSTLHEIVEYSPSWVEWKVTVGFWINGNYRFAQNGNRRVFATRSHPIVQNLIGSNILTGSNILYFRSD